MHKIKLMKMILSSKIAVIVQARMGSRRLPQKATKFIGDYCLIEWVILRLIQFFSINQIIIAIPDNEENKILASYAKKYRIRVSYGNENDVLSRYLIASAKIPDNDYVIRVCADNPFVSGALLTEMTKFCLKENLDFVHTLNKPPNFPYVDGMGAEIFKKKILNLLDFSIKELALREHVTSAVHLGKTEIEPVGMPTPSMYTSNNLRIDLDTQEDFQKILFVVEKYKLTPFSNDNQIISAFSEISYKK